MGSSDPVAAVLDRIPFDGPVPPLPDPAERVRLREAFGWTVTQMGQANEVRRETVWTWESDPPRTPRGEKGQRYARILAYFAAELARSGVQDGSANLEPEPEPEAAAAEATPLEFDFEIEDPPELSWPDPEPAPAPALTETSELEFDAPDSWTALPEGVTRRCVRCGQPTSSVVDGQPRHVHLQAMAAMGMPRCGTRSTAPAAPASAPRNESATPTPTVAATAPVVPEATGTAPTDRAAAAHSAPAPAAPRRPATTTAPRRRTVKKPAAKPVPPEYADGPLAVLDITDGALTAHLVDGRTLPCPAKTLQALAAWALDKKKIRLGAAKLHDNGFDQDPLLILTEGAVAHFGLPTDLADQEDLRLPADDRSVKNITKAGWELTKSGFGPWARLFKRLDGKRHCVQLALVPWGALETRAWGKAGALSAGDLAAMLGTYARLVITPRGTLAVTGDELMTALRPPTKAEWSAEEGKYVSAKVAHTLHTVVEPAPCEAPDEHPVVAADYPEEGSRPASEALDEEACIWVRPAELITDDERARTHVAALDVQVAFLAACRRLHVGTGPAIHYPRNPTFDPDLPGSWYLDLSHIETDPRLPSPFTSSGVRPEGPAWYATPTVAYAVELGADVRPMEAWVRETHSPYLQPWYDTLRNAYLTVMAELKVTQDLDDEAFLAAMAGYKDGDPLLVTLANAIKATAKSGIGKLRQRPNLGLDHVFGTPWPALKRRTWRPDIRAMILSKARTNMHRKMHNLATTAGRYPLAVNNDCVVYAVDGVSPLPLLLGPDGEPIRGGFRLGVNPGSVKHQGSQTIDWALDLLVDGVNIANEIKDVSLVRVA
ncbi:transcriptional regulator (plasmid) [Streptomyces sp. AM 4-1-1]|uniref:telomere-associated protein Tap n=1 Tax=Streptomyces sp. AM 4-1-1 TaxID=3028710 RepID=UPI0023B9A726|nr:transcriptional regulator [Streptomyces sp. AM 4-1-1]WEH37818.1 transcriptional regulator [Streptomyces sp. AM 4-1-1]